MERLFQEIVRTDPSDLSTISSICEHAIAIIYDNALKLLTNFKSVPPNRRKRAVEQLIGRHAVSAMLADKFETLSRLDQWPDSPQGLKQFRDNFHSFAAGLIIAGRFFMSITDRLSVLSQDNPFPEPQLNAFYEQMYYKLGFLQSIVHVLGGLAARQYDLKTLDELKKNWANLGFQINNLAIGGSIQLAAARLRAAVDRSGDAELIDSFTQFQFHAIGELEEKLTACVEKVLELQSELALSRNGLRQTINGANTAKLVTRSMPALFILCRHSQHAAPRPEEHAQIAKEILKAPGFAISFSQYPINHDTLQNELDRLINFSEKLSKLIEILPKRKPRPPPHDPSQAEGAEGFEQFENLNSRPNSQMGNPNATSHSTQVLLADAVAHAKVLHTNVETCQVFEGGEPDEIIDFHKKSSNLNNAQTTAQDTLKALRVARRDENVSELERTKCQGEVVKLDALIMISNSLLATYTRLVAQQKTSMENKNKLHFKSHTQSKIDAWPVPKHKVGSKMTVAEVNHGFLVFMSEILQFASSPYLNNAERLKKLSENISDPKIRDAVTSQATFPCCVTFLLESFKPDRQTILSITKGLSRLGQRSGATNLQEEYYNLLALNKLKMQALRSHYLLQILEESANLSSAELITIGQRLKSPKYLDELIQDFAVFVPLEEYVPQNQFQKKLTQLKCKNVGPKLKS